MDLKSGRAAVVRLRAVAEYQDERRHSTIGDVTSMEFIQNDQDRTQAVQELTSLALV